MLAACSSSGGANREGSGTASSDLAGTIGGGGGVDGGHADADSGGICTSGGAGNANHVCSSDSSWKTAAQADCQQEGRELGAFTPDEYCGKGSSDEATWTCCTSATMPQPTCAIEELKGKTCTEDSALRAQAAAACQTKEDVLQTFVGDESCGTSASKMASYTCCPYAEPALPPFRPPVSADVSGYTWAFYDIPQPTSVFENFQPQTYLNFSARKGQTFSATLTAMVSSEDWQLDPTKVIDGAIFEGRLVNGQYVFQQIARGTSEGGVLNLTARSGGSDFVHLVAFEAAASSYPGGISPSVSASLDITCAAGNHAECALGGEPGDSCIVSPATCDGPVTWCFSPEGQCSNAGTCQRIDIECSGFYAPVCTCENTTELNSCWATVDKQSIAYEGQCMAGVDGGSGAADAKAPLP
jgi:hypothetical protein